MTNTINLSANGVAMNAAHILSASRGILALQGIGLSGVGTNRVLLQHSELMHSPICVVTQDKPSAGWQPAFAKADAGVVAIEAGYAPADPAARFRRTAHQATVIRNRQRCRTR